MTPTPVPSQEEKHHPTVVAVMLTRSLRGHLRNCLRTVRGVDCPHLLHLVVEWAYKIARETDHAALRAERERTLEMRRILLSVRIEGTEEDPCWSACEVELDLNPGRHHIDGHVIECAEARALVRALSDSEPKGGKP